MATTATGAPAPVSRYQKFEYLTGETPLPNRKDEKSYKQLYTENMLRQEKLRKNPNDTNVQKPDPNFLRPPEEVCLVHSKVYEHQGWRHRYLASRGKDNNTKGYTFYAFEDEDSYLYHLATAVYPNNLYNSLVEPLVPCRFYIDMEEEYPADFPMDQRDTPEQFFDRCIVALTFLFASFDCTYGVDMAYRVCAPYFTKACIKDKNSFHCNVALLFSDIDAMNEAMFQARRDLEGLQKSNPQHPIVKALRKRWVPPARNPRQPPSPWIVDFCVYTKHRSFRTALQMKTPNKKNPLVPWDHVACKSWLTGDPLQKTYWTDGSKLPERKLWLKRTMIHRASDETKRHRLPPVTSATSLLHKLSKLMEDKPSNNTSPAEAASQIMHSLMVIYYPKRGAVVGKERFKQEVDEMVSTVRTLVMKHIGGDRRKAWTAVRWMMYSVRVCNLQAWPFTTERLEKIIVNASEVSCVGEEIQQWAYILGMTQWSHYYSGDQDALPLQDMNPNDVARFALLHFRLSHLFSKDEYQPHLRKGRQPQAGGRPYTIEQFLRLYPVGLMYSCLTSGDDDMSDTERKEIRDNGNPIASTKEMRQARCWFIPSNDEEHSDEKHAYEEEEWRKNAREWYIAQQKLEQPYKPIKPTTCSSERTIPPPPKNNNNSNSNNSKPKTIVVRNAGQDSNGSSGSSGPPASSPSVGMAIDSGSFFNTSTSSLFNHTEVPIIGTSVDPAAPRLYAIASIYSSVSKMALTPRPGLISGPDGTDATTVDASSPLGPSSDPEPDTRKRVPGGTLAHVQQKKARSISADATVSV